MWWSKKTSRTAKQQVQIQSASTAPKRRAPLMMSLEPRFMFDGAVAASHAESLHAASDHGHMLDHLRPVEAAAAAPAVTASGPAVIFIDSRVSDPASLLQGMAAGTEVVYLNANQDGLQQIASYLAAHHEVGSVEIIAHGNDGELLLGDTLLNSSNVSSYAQTLGAIGSNLKQGADILVYACDTAADSQGVAFVDTLARLTGHNIAASTGDVGAAGSWDLGFSTGDITAQPVLSAAAEASYQDNLGLLEVTSSADDGTAGTLRYEIANSASGDVIYFETGITTVSLSMTNSSALSITHNLTIESDLAGDGASGNQVTINANHYSGVMSITGGNVSLIGLTLENGMVAGNGGGYGTAVNAPTAGGNALGGGLYVAGSSTVVTLNHVNFTSNDATGGGGAGSGSSATGLGGYNYGGGGGSGFAGFGGGKGGRLNSPTYVYNSTPSSFPGANPGNGNGGGAGYAGSSSYAGSGGIGGNPTVNVNGQAGAGGVASGGFSAGGAGAKAGSGTSAIGGGGGGSGELNGSHGTAGGEAAGGLYVGKGGKVYMANAVFSHNYGAGGGGGGSYAGTAGAGGGAGGAILVGATGTLKYQSSTVTFTANVGMGGSGGTTYTGSGGGTAGANGSSSGATGIATTTGSTVATTYVPPTTVTAVTVPSNATYITGESLNFTVTFSAAVNVTGNPEIPITLDTGGTVEATYASGSGSTTLDFSYTIAANEQDSTGITVGALNLNGGTIKDASSASAVTTFSSVPSTTGVLVDSIAPTVSSINRVGSTPNDLNTDQFTVTFSENVTGVNASDFTLTDSGVTAIVTGVTGSGSVYTVTVGSVSGNGTMRLDLNSSGTGITDIPGNAISGGFTSGQQYTVDQTPPTVSSIVPSGSNPGKGGSEAFTVTFSEAVSGVDSSDFTAITSGTTDTGITSVTTSDNIHYTVTVGGVGGNGSLGLNLNSSGTGITDLAGNAISGGFTGSTYTIDTTPPTVSSISTVGASTNNANSESFTVVFSEAVTGVAAGDFTLTTANTGGTALSDTGIASITGSGTTYTVTVDNVAGNGTMRLDLKSNSTGITDTAGNGAVASFTSGGVYTIEHTPPAVTSITADGALTNNAGSEVYTVTFSENVTGLNTGDFSVNLTGTANYTGLAITPLSGSQYQVTVQGVTGDGTVQLAFNGSPGDVSDAAGNIASANFSGDTYNVEHTPPTISSVGVPGDGTYIAGQDLTFTVNFSEAVTVSGTPELPITLDVGGTVYAQYVSGSGTSALTFRYTVVSGEGDTNGIAVGSALILNSGSIADAATNSATLTLNDVGDTSGVLVDSIAPTVSSVSVPTDGTYGAGEVLTFTVNFSESVLVTTGGGTPYINVTLDTGGTVQAAYISGSGTNELTFALTVASGEADLTGIAVGSSIVANGGTIKDAATNAAVLTLNSVASTTNVLVDAVPPTVTSIDITGNAVNNGSSENYLVTFDVPVHGVDASDFGFTTVSGDVTASSISVIPLSSTTYSVTIGGVTGDGVLRLDLTGGDPITDNFGNTLVATHTGDQTYTVDHTPPTITAVTLPTDGTYIAGQDLDFTLTFSEAVTVDTTGGTPRIDIAIVTPSGTTIYANYVSGSGTNTLVFQTTVQPGWQDLTGITVVNSGNLDVNGGTIKDAAGNSETNFALTGIGSTAAIEIDAIVPDVTSVDVPTNGTYGVGQDLDFTLNFNKTVLVDLTGGTPYIQITLDTGGTVDAVYISGSGTSALVFQYVIPSGEFDSNGITVGNTLFTGGGTVTDSIGNNADSTMSGIADTTGVLVDSTVPTVSSIDIAGTSPNNAGSETYTVTFDKAVSGVDVTDFTVVGTGTASGVVDTVSGSGTTWTVTVGSVVGDGTLRLDLNNSGDTITDAHGNSLTAAHTGDESYTVQHTPPAATGMTVPADGTYGVGQDMDFTITYSEVVTVTGTPRIAITLDTGGTVYANLVAGSGTNTLTFRFTPVAGEQDLTGIVTDSVVDLNGGTIKDAAGNSANLAINTVEPSLTNVDVDAIVPVVDSVDVPGSATYIGGQDLDFTVNFNKPMTVDLTGGTPYITLTLATGGTVDAMYVSGSGNSSLVFEYAVVAGEGAPSGVVLGSAITLNGGTIDDAHSNAANLTLNDVASTTGVVVDSIPPTVTSITTNGATTTNAASVTYTVTFSEAVAGVDVTDFTLTDTGATKGTIASVTAVSGSVYTVTVNSISGDGTMRLDLNSSGTGIADLATNAIATGFTAGHLYTFDHSSASLVSVGVPNPGTYTEGQDLDFTVTYSESVNVDTSGGTPRIAITLDNGETVYANYVSGSGSTTLTFEYVVAKGDIDGDGITLAGSIDNNGGNIQDNLGNSAGAVLADVGDTSHVLVDGTDPVVSSIATTGSGTSNADTLTYTVTFSEAVTGVNAGDFVLTTTGSAGGTIESVTAVNASTYTVTVDNVSGSGTLRLDLPLSSGVTDTAGTAVAGYTGGGTYSVDHTPLGVTDVTVPAKGDYVAGQTLNFDVTFSQAVTVDTTGGVPSINITLDSGTVQAHYVSGSGSTTLVFSYTVVAGDKDSNGIVVGSTINANGGTLAGASNSSVGLALTNVPSTSDVDVGLSTTPPTGEPGRGILPGCDTPQWEAAPGPTIWLAPSEGDNPVHSPEANLFTTQDTWSSVPLLSAGQQGFGYYDGSDANRGDASEVGNSGFDGPEPGVIDQLVNPLPVRFNAAESGNLDRSNLLNWRAPQNSEAASFRLDSAQVQSGKQAVDRLAPAAGIVLGIGNRLGVEAVQRHVEHAVPAHAAPASAVPALAARPVNGKASLNQQFSRYGQKAWEREKSVLVDNAQRIAQRRAG